MAPLSLIQLIVLVEVVMTIKVGDKIPAGTFTLMGAEGIATSVRTKWAIQLVIVSIAIIILVKLVQKIFVKFGLSFYNMSFNEGNTSNSLEIFSSKKIDFVENSENIISSYNDKESGEVTYRMSFENKNKLQDFKNKIENDSNIRKINVIFN